MERSAFTFFSKEEYSTHPWHQHSQLILAINSDVNDAIISLRQFCDESFTYYRKLPPSLEMVGPLCFNSKEWLYVKRNENITVDDLRAFIQKVVSALF